MLNLMDFSHSEAIKNSIFLISILKNLNFDKNITFTCNLILIWNILGPKLTWSIPKYWDFQNKNKFFSVSVKLENVAVYFYFSVKVKLFWTLWFDEFFMTLWISSQIANPSNNRRVKPIQESISRFHKVSKFCNCRRFLSETLWCGLENFSSSHKIFAKKKSNSFIIVRSKM